VPRQIHTYTDPDRFVAGTVGMPGERTFYLQAIQGASITSVSIEKAQVAALAERIEAMMAEAGVVTPPWTVDDNDPLALPLDDEFRVGALSLAWDPTEQQILLEAYAVDDSVAPDIGDDDPHAADTLWVRLTSAQAFAFVRRAQAIVSAGRPPCPFCMQPLDSSGHICPRANGYRRRT